MSNEQSIPSAFFLDPNFRFWQAIGDKAKPARGTVVSASFAAPGFLAVPYAGFPDEVIGNRIAIQCVASGDEFPVSRFRMNDQRATSFVQLPGEFCSGPVRVVASIDGSEFISVGTPFAISEAMYVGQTGIHSRAMVVAATWAMGLIIWFLSAFAVSRGSTQIGAVTSGMVGTAVVGMVLIAAFTIGPVSGKAVVSTLAVAALVGAALVSWKWRDWSIGWLRNVALPASLWLLFALFAAGLVTAADNGSGAWWINSLFTPLRWSSDNQIPYQFAEALVTGTPPSDIHWGPWLATDRTPLLSGFLLAARVLIITPFQRSFGPTFIPIAYMMSSIVFLTAWVAVLVEIVRRADVKALAVVVLLACTTPFLLFNSVYAWPKLLGAAYVLIAFGLLMDLSVRRSRNPIALYLVALAAVSAILAHSSNAFALFPIALLFAPTLLRQGIVPLFCAALAAILVTLPWLYWQAILQPGGNALLRFALAFDYEAGNRSRPLLSAIRDAYSSMTFNGWLAGKRSSAALMLGLEAPDFGMPEMAAHSAGAGPLGAARVLDFLSVGHALSIAGLGLLAVPFLSHFARTGFAASSMARMAALAGVTGVLLGLLVMLPPGIVHHQPYGSLLLLVLAGALAIAAAPAWLTASATVLSVGYFAVVWVWHPIATAVTVHGSAIALMVWSAAGIGWLLFMWPRDDDAVLRGSSVEAKEA
ncbi:hypothetical protein [Kaistia algarum]|uniref:hypothetical protein n=1 Tax=Kaistia algarum TaxID=2083279 RepID=UPI0014034D6C|nr:hypothetical protein [Kaistia algarum]MCX5515528.1 hypothetical protein [Kaistia algarum]